MAMASGRVWRKPVLLTLLRSYPTSPSLLPLPPWTSTGQAPLHQTKHCTAQFSHRAISGYDYKHPNLLLMFSEMGF